MDTFHSFSEYYDLPNNEFHSPLPPNKYFNDSNNNILVCTTIYNYEEGKKIPSTINDVKKALLFDDNDAVNFKEISIEKRNLKTKTKNVETQCSGIDFEDLSNDMIIDSKDLSNISGSSQSANNETPLTESFQLPIVSDENSLDFLENIQTSKKNLLLHSSICELFDPLLEIADNKKSKNQKPVTVVEFENTEDVKKENSEIENSLLVLISPIKNTSIAINVPYNNFHTEKEPKQIIEIQEHFSPENNNKILNNPGVGVLNFSSAIQSVTIGSTLTEIVENIQCSSVYFKDENSSDFQENSNKSKQDLLTFINSICEMFDPFHKKVDTNGNHLKVLSIKKNIMENQNYENSNTKLIELKNILSSSVYSIENNTTINKSQGQLTMEKDLEQAFESRESAKQKTNSQDVEENEKLKVLHKLFFYLQNMVQNYAKLIRDLKYLNESFEIEIASSENRNEILNCHIKSSSVCIEEVKLQISALKDRLNQYAKMQRQYKMNEIKLKTKIEDLRAKEMQMDILINNLQLKSEAFSDDASCNAMQTVLDTRIKKNEIKMVSLESSLTLAKKETTEIKTIIDELQIIVNNQ